MKKVIRSSGEQNHLTHYIVKKTVNSYHKQMTRTVEKETTACRPHTQ